jgi:hypothetical protein
MGWHWLKLIVPSNALRTGSTPGSAGDLPEGAPRRVTEKAVSVTEPAPAKIGDQPLLSKLGKTGSRTLDVPIVAGMVFIDGAAPATSRGTVAQVAE